MYELNDKFISKDDIYSKMKSEEKSEVNEIIPSKDVTPNYNEIIIEDIGAYNYLHGDLIKDIFEYQKNNIEQWTPFFKKLLLVQTIVIYIFMILNSVEFIPFNIEKELIIVLVTGMFIEIISIIGVMIKYIYSDWLTKIHNIISANEKIKKG